MGIFTWLWFTSFINFRNFIWKMDWNFNISIFNFFQGINTLCDISNFFFAETVKIVEKKFSKFIEKNLNKTNFIIFLLLDWLEVLEFLFGLQNVLPVLFSIKKTNYFFASILGFVPIFFIWNSIGSGLNEYIKNEENFSFLLLLIQKRKFIFH